MVPPLLFHLCTVLTSPSGCGFVSSKALLSTRGICETTENCTLLQADNKPISGGLGRNSLKMTYVRGSFEMKHVLLPPYVLVKHKE